MSKLKNESGSAAVYTFKTAKKATLKTLVAISLNDTKTAHPSLTDQLLEIKLHVADSPTVASLAEEELCKACIDSAYDTGFRLNSVTNS